MVCFWELMVDLKGSMLAKFTEYHQSVDTEILPLVALPVAFSQILSFPVPAVPMS